MELIANDLLDHDWYSRLVLLMIRDVESYLARWTAFEAAVDDAAA